MRLFSYRALDASGNIQSGTLRAMDVSVLEAELYRQRLEPIAINIQREKTGRGSTLRLRPNELLRLSQDMTDLLESGVSLTDSLSCIKDSTTKNGISALCSEVLKRIHAGITLSEAFEPYRSAFGDVFILLLQAGERSGDLVATFERLTYYLSWKERIRKSIVKALTYPLFLLLITLAVATFMMLVVVPQIIEFLTSLGTQLPLSTRILIHAADFFSYIWWGLPSLFFGVFLLAIALSRSSTQSKKFIDFAVYKIPKIGPTLWSFEIARVLRTFGLLLRSGVSIVEALQIATMTVRNTYFHHKTDESLRKLQQGSKLSAALAGVFPDHFVQSVSVAEKAGSLQRVIERGADHIERNAEERTLQFIGILEPSLTILVGAMFAWIVLAVLGPVYGSLAVLSRGM